MEEPQNLALKDCRVCNRRRIKCDRRLPKCGKCDKRGLTCSGYGLLLKWDQGVASRGNLKGKHFPIQPVKKSLAKLQTQDIVPHSIPLSIRGDDSGQSPEVEESSNFQFNALPQPFISTQLQVPDHRRLLHHFDRIVAPNMAWADSPGNAWRHIIIPLAFQSPPLMAAILSFAAKHIDAVTSNSGEAPSKEMTLYSNTFQQRAIKLLAQEVHSFTTTDASLNQSNAILATMLVLCNVETVWPDSPVWQVHLNAARTVLASRRSTISPKLLADSTSTFLEQELFIANTFASTTNFTSPTVSDDLWPTVSELNGIFVEFLKMIQMVTSLERQAATNPSTLSGVSLSGLRKLFEHARSRIQVSKGDDYLHLSRAVNCFYHAGLIYACRALLNDDQIIDLPSKMERDSQIASSTLELFRFLEFAEPSKPTFAQDLVWPLFIAGTEALHKYEQEMVVTKLQQAMSRTGFSNCQHALEFLRALWEKRAEAVSGVEFYWISFAREWTGQGRRTFFVF